MRLSNKNGHGDGCLLLVAVALPRSAWLATRAVGSSYLVDYASRSRALFGTKFRLHEEVRSRCRCPPVSLQGLDALEGL